MMGLEDLHGGVERDPRLSSAAPSTVALLMRAIRAGKAGVPSWGLAAEGFSEADAWAALACGWLSEAKEGSQSFLSCAPAGLRAAAWVCPRCEVPLSIGVALAGIPVPMASAAREGGARALAAPSREDADPMQMLERVAKCPSCGMSFQARRA